MAVSIVINKLFHHITQIACYLCEINHSALGMESSIRNECLRYHLYSFHDEIRAQNIAGKDKFTLALAENM